jgi:hypothetical protein
MQLSLFVGQQDLDTALSFIQATRAETHQLHPLLEDLQGLLKSQFIVFELGDDLLQALQRPLKCRFLHRLILSSSRRSPCTVGSLAKA